MEAEDLGTGVVSQLVGQGGGGGQPLLGGDGGTEHVLIVGVVATVADGGQDMAGFLDERQLSPPPLLNGGDLVDHGPPLPRRDIVRPMLLDEQADGFLEVHPLQLLDQGDRVAAPVAAKASRVLLGARFDVDHERGRLFDVEGAFPDQPAAASGFQFDAVVRQHILDPDAVLGGFGVRRVHAASLARSFRFHSQRGQRSHGC